MARPLKPATPADVALVESALADLKSARDKLAKAGATSAVERVRLAITSTGGAARHVQSRLARS